MKRENTRRLVHLGMLAGISLLLVYLVHFPIIPGVSFLEYDMADVPILIGTFLYGPAWGVLLTAAVSLLQWLLVSPAGGWIGALMHFVATGSFALLAGAIYLRRRTRGGAVIGLVSGALVMTGMMVLMNLWLTPIFMGVDRQTVISMLLPAIVPFNVIKTALNGVLTFLLYKAVARVLRIEREAPRKPTPENE